MARLSKIRIGMAVLDRTGAIVGTVKALELAEGIKPSPNLVLDGTQGPHKLGTTISEVARTNRPARKGHLLIETSEGKEIVESLESIHRVADTAVHLAVARRMDTSDGSLEGV